MNNIKSYALKLLKIKQRSKKELEEKLLKKGYTKDKINGCIDYLEKLGFINDLKFAEMFIENRKRKGVGKAFIRMELLKKGVGKDVIGEALSLYKNESEVIYNIAEKKKKFYIKTDEKKVKEKLYMFLIRRGFNREAVRQVVDRIIND